MPLKKEGVEVALKRLAGVKVGDKVSFDLSHGRPVCFDIDRKGLFQGLGRRAEDSISRVENQKAIAYILMAGAEEASCGRIERSVMDDALAGLANLSRSYDRGSAGNRQAASNLLRRMNTVWDEVRMWDNPCLALIPGRKENLDLRTSKDTPQPPFAHWWDALSTFMVQ